MMSELRVTFLRRTNGEIYGFEVMGHAPRLGDLGDNIVCAGVSALAQAALLGLQEFADQYVTAEVRPGYLRAEVGLTGWDEAPRVQAILRTLDLGLMGIERMYPGTLTIRYGG